MRGQSGTHLHYKPRYIYPETISHWIMYFYKSITIKQNVWDISALSTFKEWWVDNILSIVWRPEVASSSCAAPSPPHTTGHTHIPLATCHEGSRVTCHADTGRADLCTGSRFKTQYNLITSPQKNSPQLVNVLSGLWPGEAADQRWQPGCCVKWNTTASNDALMLDVGGTVPDCSENWHN